MVEDFINLAGEAGDLNGVRDILGKSPHLINARNQIGQTALMWAAYYNRKEVLKFLILSGGLVNFQNLASGDTALHLAAAKGDETILAILLGANADLSLQNRDGNTALHSGCKYGHTQRGINCARKLILNGANIALENMEGDAPLKMIIEKSYPGPRAQYLMNLGLGASLDWEDAAVQACKEGNEISLTQMIESGTAVCHVGMGTGRSLLHFACTFGRERIAMLLLERGADCSATDKEGVTCLELALEGSMVAVVIAMLQTQSALKIFEVCTEKDVDVDIHSIRKIKMDKAEKVSRRRNKTLALIMEEKELICGAIFPLEYLSHNFFTLWFHIIQMHEMDASVSEHGARLQLTIREYMRKYPHLRSVCDERGRQAVDVATPAHRRILDSVLWWYGRYRVLDPRPEHVSATCSVYRALDELEPITDTSDTTESSIDATKRSHRPSIAAPGSVSACVALKVFRFYSNFSCELSARQVPFSEDCVVPMLRFHSSQKGMDNESTNTTRPTADGHESDAFSVLPSVAVVNRLHAIVMPWADRNLFVAIKQENFAGRNMFEVRHVFTQLVRGLEHFHSLGRIHGDVKPLNIVRINAQWRLIDLDAAVELGTAMSSNKFSSAYIPPEAIYVDGVVAVVRSDRQSIQANELTGCEPLIAHVSFDAWSLGCVLFELCTAMPLFRAGLDDNLSDQVDDDDSLWTLSDWNEHTKSKKLKLVKDYVARNLIAQLLSKDPTHRPVMSRVLFHPFVSQSRTRMRGEPPEFDVFVSYREASDNENAAILYQLLVDVGLRVWWDKTGLKGGLPWKEGFCKGMASSCIVVCIISKEGINHPTVNRQNFATLDVDSACDNVFLEYRLALELRELGLIQRVFPLLVGERAKESAGDEHAPFFSGSPLPQCRRAIVRAIESDLASHMALLGLGTPIIPTERTTVQAVLANIMECQGAKIEGKRDVAFAQAVDSLKKVVGDCG